MTLEYVVGSLFFAALGGAIVGLVVTWRTWAEVFVEVRDHGWRNDR